MIPAVFTLLLTHAFFMLEANAWTVSHGDNLNEAVVCLAKGESIKARVLFFDPSDDDEGTCQGNGYLKVRESGAEIAPIYDADGDTNRNINITFDGEQTWENDADYKKCVFFIYSWKRKFTGSILAGSCTFHGGDLDDPNDFRAITTVQSGAVHIRYKGEASSVSGEGHADVNVDIISASD